MIICESTREYWTADFLRDFFPFFALPLPSRGSVKRQFSGFMI